MSEMFWLIAAAALSFSGMAWLALAMEVHWDQVMQQPAEEATQTRSWLRRLGATALTLSLLSCLMAGRPSMAALVWIMLLAGSALAVAMVLSRRAHWLRPWCLAPIAAPTHG